MWNHVAKEAVLIYHFVYENDDYLSANVETLNSKRTILLTRPGGDFPI